MSHHRILLVEDSAAIQMVVTSILKSKYSVKAVASCSDALLELKQNSYSLILLDVELPDSDGFKLCAQLKLDEKHRETPIVFLSGKQHPTDKVMGLSLGAEDYITKPIEPLEFQARVDARIRSFMKSQSAQETLMAGVFKLIPSEQKLFLLENGNEKPLEFTTLEYKIFYYLFKNQEKILSRDQILSAIWGDATHVTDRTIDSHIYAIRQKLGKFSVCIQSIPRAGYRYSQIETKLAV